MEVLDLGEEGREGVGLVWVAVERWKRGVGFREEEVEGEGEGGWLGMGMGVVEGGLVTVWESFWLRVWMFVEAVSRREWRAEFRDSTIGLTKTALAP